MVSGIASAALLAVQAAAQQPLNLTCLGSGTANKVAVATANSSGGFMGTVGTTPMSGSTYGTSTITSKRQQGFEDQVDIRLFSGEDRIRLPRTMLPALHGGSDGWFKLKNVVVDARSIHGKASVNFMNNPNVFIDRLTGTISISGRVGDYSGECHAVDANAAVKF
jgi:hypothetical protein